jgi:Zn-dependent protease
MVPGASILTQAMCVAVFVFFPVNLLLCFFNAIPLPPLDGWMFFSTLFRKGPTKIMQRVWVIPVSLISAVCLMRAASGYMNGVVRYLVGMGLS